MHPHRLQQLVASVPDTVDADQRARLLAHVQASDRCRVRIECVSAELDRILDGVGNTDRAVDLASELDGLERVQQRMDRRLTALVDELTSTPRAVPYDDGVPA
ncbi:hypothetical protein [Pseudonocardia zijingensis]|uniref:Uncharacterized protein n=1 Tax=Pseudonocardia zijingensis TaxID=153376 RepID=A0ABP3ZSC9_9PSEU